MLRSLGIKLRENATDWRDFQDVLDDVAAGWENYDDTQRRAIANAFGMTRQQEKILVLMENYDEALALAEVATNSAGTAAEKYNTFLEGLEARLNSLTSAFESLSQSLLNSDGMKVLIDGATSAVTAIDKLISSIGLLPTLLGGIGLGTALSGKGLVGDKGLFKLNSKDLFSSWGISRNFLKPREFASLEKFASEIDEIGAGSETASAHYDLFMKSVGKSTPVFGDAANAIQAGSASVSKYASSVVNWGAMIKGALVNIGISLAISAIAAGIEYLITMQQRAIDKADELTNAYNDSISEISNNVQYLESVGGEFAKLSKGVDEYGKNVSLTADEYERYKEIITKVVDISPSLIIGYNNEGLALANNNTLLAEAIRLQEALNYEKQNEYLEGGDDKFKAARAKQKKSLFGFFERDTVAEALNPRPRNSGDVYNYGDFTGSVSAQGVLGGMGLLSALNRSGQSTEDVISAYREIVAQGEIFVEQYSKRLGLERDEQEALRGSLVEMRKMVREYDNANQEVSTFLGIYASRTNANGDYEVSEYGDVQIGYLDEVQAAFDKIAADPLLTFDEAKTKVDDLVIAFASVQDSLPTEKIAEMQDKLVNGEISIEAYEESVKILSNNLSGLKQQFPELAVLIDIITAGWLSFTAATDGASGAAGDGADAFTKLREALAKIKDGSRPLKDLMTSLSGGDISTFDFEELLNEFPQLQDELQKYADGLITVDDLQQVLQATLDDFNADNIEKALQNAQSVIENYGVGTNRVDQAMQELVAAIPGLEDALSVLGVGFDATTVAGFDSAGALLTYAAAALQAAIESKRADLSNLRTELNRVAEAAANSAAELGGLVAMEALQSQIQQGETDLAGLEGALKKLSDFKVTSPKGGGGSSSPYSKEYEQQKELTEHFIKMSKLRQETMGEETESWRNEQQQQLTYYMQIANLISQEMARLKAKGVSATSSAMRSLAEEYQSIQNILYNLQKAQIEAAYNSQIRALEKERDAIKDSYNTRVKDYDYRLDKVKALLSLEQNYHELQKSILAEQRSLTNEIEKSRLATDQTDPSLFTEGDYADLSGKLTTIQGDLDTLYNDYLVQIQNLTKDEIYKVDYITSQFEQQVKLKNLEYQVAKNNLAVMKAQIQLENAQSERNVAQLKDGKWTWGADPEQVRQAMDALTEAENAVLDAQSDFLYQQKVAAYEETIASIEMQKKLAEREHEAVMERIDKQIQVLNDQLAAMLEALANMDMFAGGVQDAFTSLAGAVSQGVNAVSAAAAQAAQAAYSAGNYKEIGSTSSTQLLFKQGSSGSGVTVIEDILATNGYLNQGLVDGSYDATTKAAVKAMQKDLGVTADGIVGPKTLEAMAKKYGAKQSSSPSGIGWASPGYASGGVADFTGPANLHGSASKSEVIFNSKDAAKLYNLVHSTDDLSFLFVKKMGKFLGDEIKRLIPAREPVRQTNTPTGQQIYINGVEVKASRDELAVLGAVVRRMSPLIRTS